jgi:hypothetical protein
LNEKENKHRPLRVNGILTSRISESCDEVVSLGVVVPRKTGVKRNL